MQDSRVQFPYARFPVRPKAGYLALNQQIQVRILYGVLYLSIFRRPSLYPFSQPCNYCLRAQKNRTVLCGSFAIYSHACFASAIGFYIFTRLFCKRDWLLYIHTLALTSAIGFYIFTHLLCKRGWRCIYTHPNGSDETCRCDPFWNHLRDNKPGKIRSQQVNWKFF